MSLATHPSLTPEDQQQGANDYRPCCFNRISQSHCQHPSCQFEQAGNIMQSKLISYNRYQNHWKIYCCASIAVLIGAAGATWPSHAASPAGLPASRMACLYSTLDAIQCSTPATGTLLTLNLEMLPRDGQTKTLKSPRTGGVGDASWDAGEICKSVVTSLSSESGSVRVSGRHDCATPIRMCLNIQTPQEGASFLSNVAVIQVHNIAIAIMGDYRLATNIDPARKLVRLCSDPKGLTSGEWTIDLLSGSMNEIRDSVQRMPAPILDSAGRVIGYSKKSPVIMDGYFFVNLTENNAATFLPLIQKSSFPYIMIRASAWATSMGSYVFNPEYYPRGISGLKHVVDAANSMGMKVGLHTLTGFVSKSDPYVRGGIPDARLLQDDRTTLLRDIDAKSTAITATDSLGTFPTQPAFYGNKKGGQDIRIDDEIISCPMIIVAKHGQFGECKRGLYGTKATAHSAGTPIGHLAERYGSYLADLGSSLKEDIAIRLADIVNQGGIDMIYFDGGEVGAASGDPGWYVAEQQIAVLKRVRRPLLVEGSGLVPRLWPFLTRLVTDDFASLAPIDYLDTHKIGRIHKKYVSELMPDNLGWLALLKETPSYPATTPEEISTYVARSLALDRPLAIETHLDDLLKNPYTARLMNILRAGNQTIRVGSLSTGSREELGQREWYYTETDSPKLRRLRLMRSSSGADGSLFKPVRAQAEETQVLVRIRNIRQTSLDAAGTIPLVGDNDPPRSVNGMVINDGNRGQLVDSIPLSSQTAGAGGTGFTGLVDSSLGRGELDLRSARQMVVDYEYVPHSDTTRSAEDDACAILNLQLVDNRENYRDYFLPLKSGRQRALIDYESTAPLMLRKFRPSENAYAFKAAVYVFNFAAVTKLNIRWMSSCGNGVPVRLARVAMVKEHPGGLRDVRLRVGNTDYPLVREIRSGETLDVFPEGQLTVCKQTVCSTKEVKWPSGGALSGQAASIDYLGASRAEITLGLIGKGVEVGANHTHKR